MTIRIKLMLWYVSVLFTSILLCTLLLYHEWVVEPQEARKQKYAERLQARERARYAPQQAKENGKDEQDEELNPDEFVEDLTENVLWIAIPATVLGLAGGWWLMRKAMTPVVALTRAVEQMSENNLNVQLPGSGNGDEFDRLTAVFNDMAARLSDSFHRIREFTLRASHELKTPLTIMRSSMETALARQHLTAEQEARLLDDLDEVDRLAKIVDGLTLLTKADAGLIALKQEPVRLDSLVREIYSDGQVLAQPSNISISLGDCDETIIPGDNNRLRQVLLNLMDNAVKYNSRGGSIALSLRNTGSHGKITIANTGPGVPPEMLPQLFDPFFRADASHTREIDGCGLGLAIVQWIVTAHKGTVSMTSRPDPITTVKILLPLAGNDDPANFKTTSNNPPNENK